MHHLVIARETGAGIEAETEKETKTETEIGIQNENVIEKEQGPTTIGKIDGALQESEIGAGAEVRKDAEIMIDATGDAKMSEETDGVKKSIVDVTGAQ